MATFAQILREYEARKRRLDEAESRGWRDCIPYERDNVAELEHVLLTTAVKHIPELIALTETLDVGTLPVGISLAFSGQEDDEPSAPKP